MSSTFKMVGGVLISSFSASDKTTNHKNVNSKMSKRCLLVYKNGRFAEICDNKVAKVYLIRGTQFGTTLQAIRVSLSQIYYPNYNDNIYDAKKYRITIPN